MYSESVLVEFDGGSLSKRATAKHVDGKQVYIEPEESKHQGRPADLRKLAVMQVRGHSMLRLQMAGKGTFLRGTFASAWTSSDDTTCLVDRYVTKVFLLEDAQVHNIGGNTDGYGAEVGIGKGRVGD